ncbi:MAG TPA: alpha/beta fold hydrolase [Gammaproteobacteria bacterium]
MRFAYLAWLGLAAASVQPVAAAEGPLHFDACRLATGSLPAAFAHCATLTVPEDPRKPEGRTVELFVARVGAQTATPRPDPLVIIAGGPGQSTVDFYLQVRRQFEPVRRDRELVLLDQRGTGRSAGDLTCETPDDLSLAMAGTEALERYVERCLAEIDGNPRFYTTSVAVQDLERVRAALGVEQWNLYGVSYGTRVAQHYLRRFPERTRAVILDGVVPADVALGPDVAPHAQAALERLFARCAEDAACADRFGDVEARFRALAAAVAERPLEAEPLDARSGRRTPVAFTSAHLQAVVRFMSYSPATASLLPLLVTEALEGNPGPLVSQARTLLQNLPEALSFPMHNSVVCTEDYPFFPVDARAGLGETYLGTVIVDGLEAICSRWPRGVMDDDFKEPVVSDRPVLLLSGEHDPITPPAYAERAIAGGLRRSAHLVGPGQGHGLLGVGCVPRLMRAFLESADPAAVDGDCVAREPPPPFFLSFMGPAP